MKQFQSFPLGPDEIHFGLGLGCSITWVGMNFHSVGLFAGWGYQSEKILDGVYLLSIIVVTVTLLLTAYFDKKAKAFLSVPRTRLLIPCGVALSTLIMPASGFPELLGTMGLVASGVLSGISSALFLVIWGETLASLPIRKTIASTAVAYASSCLLFLLFSFFEPFAAVMFAASMPLISYSFMKQGLCHFNQIEESEKPEGKEGAFQELFFTKVHDSINHQSKRMIKKVVVKLTVSVAIIGFVNEAVRTLYVNNNVSSISNHSFALIQGVTSLTVTLVALTILIGLIAFPKKLGAEYCYRFMFLVAILGTLLLPLTYSQHVGTTISYAVNAVSYQCFGITMWIVIAGVCHRIRENSIRIFSLIRSAWAFGPLVGMLLGRHIVRLDEFSYPSLILFSMIGVLLIAAVYTFIFTENDLRSIVSMIPTKSNQRFRRSCLALAKRHRLSDRETEILILFAKGRNSAFIQEELCVSKSTVSTHRQHIYRKLGIHSNQELIDCVQQIPLDEMLIPSKSR